MTALLAIIIVVWLCKEDGESRPKSNDTTVEFRNGGFVQSRTRQEGKEYQAEGPREEYGNLKDALCFSQACSNQC